MFRLFGDECYLDFLKFVCSVSYSVSLRHYRAYLFALTPEQLWNFLSMEPMDISSFAFFAFCDKSNMLMSYENLDSLMRTVHGDGYAGNKALKGIVDNKMVHLKVHLEKCTLEEFSDLCRKNRFIVDPMTRLQLSLRARLLGESFWKHATTLRYEKAPRNGQNFVLEVSRDAVASTASLIEKKRKRGPPEKIRRSSIALLRETMLKVAPVRQSRVVHQYEGAVQLPEKPRRRRSLIRPNLTVTTEDKRADETMNFVTMLSDTKAHKKKSKTDGSGDLVITVVDANKESGDINSENWKQASRIESPRSSPRANRTNSPRSRDSSPHQSPRVHSANTRSKHSGNLSPSGPKSISTSPRNSPRSDVYHVSTSRHDF